MLLLLEKLVVLLLEELAAQAEARHCTHCVAALLQFEPSARLRAERCARSGIVVDGPSSVCNLRLPFE